MNVIFTIYMYRMYVVCTLSSTTLELIAHCSLEHWMVKVKAHTHDLIYFDFNMRSWKLGTQAAPTVTQRSVTGQHTWPCAQLLAAPWQNFPVIGVKQCLASGQQ